MKLPFALILALGPVLVGQQVGVVGYGYVLPARVDAAPGQLLTLVVTGVSRDLKQTIRAPGGTDLPTSLGGISVGYWQSTPRPAPILEVRPFSTCSDPFLQATCSSLTGITIQVPLDAQSCPQCPPYGIAVGLLNLVQNGTVGLLADVEPLADQVHMVTGCDPFMTTVNYAAHDPSGLPCATVVAHADGSLVSVNTPAKAGEELVAYAVGLGQTNPPSVTGKLVTTAVPTQTTFTLDFNYRPNALAAKPLPNAPQPLFAGLTPGYVGLYQVNFVVPPVPQGTPACVDTSNLLPAPGQNFVQSNLTVSVGGAFSFDGARICVAVPTP